MRSSPARKRRRRYLALAFAASLLLHLTAGALWATLGRQVATAIARVVPHPRPTPEPAVAAIIRIEKRPPARVPPPARPHRAAVAQPPARRLAAQAPALRPLPLPTLAPVLPARPTLAPLPRPPVTPAERAPARVALVRPAPPPRAGRAAPATAAAGRSGFSAQQIAALDAQFQRTIDGAQKSLADGPPAQRTAALGTRTYKRYDPAILAGRSEDALASEGVCDPLDTPTVHGGYSYYFLRCRVTFTDGFSEEVSFPWQFRFTPREDPFRYQDGRAHHFPVQAPPAGFVLQHPFALSRTICAFYHDDCQAVVAKERAAGE